MQTPPDVAFRQAEPPDLALLVGMMRAYYTLDAIPFDEARATRAMQGLIASPAHGEAYVIEHAGTPVGYLGITLGYSLEFGGVDAFLDELFVAEAWRGRGIGTAALSFAEQACRARGVVAVHLEVERHNPRARALYERFGFEPHDRYLMSRWLAR